MSDAASDPREAAEAALMEAADEYGEECADRQNLPYKYGTVADRQESEEWAAVRAAYRQGVVVENERFMAVLERIHRQARPETEHGELVRQIDAQRTLLEELRRAL